MPKSWREQHQFDDSIALFEAFWDKQKHMVSQLQACSTAMLALVASSRRLSLMLQAISSDWIHGSLTWTWIHFWCSWFFHTFPAESTGCSVPGFHSPLQFRDHPHLELHSAAASAHLCVSAVAKDMFTMMWFKTGSHCHFHSPRLVCTCPQKKIRGWCSSALSWPSCNSISSSGMLLVNDVRSSSLQLTHCDACNYTNYPN